MTAISQSVRIHVPEAVLSADVTVPRPARGVVLFAHGSGSGRHSPRNRYVAGELHDAGLATVLADLLTTVEAELDERSGVFRFDIGLLAARVTALTDWLTGQQALAGLGLGLYGASTGAAAALVAAAERPAAVSTVVSRGGRTDLAGGSLRRVYQPVLLIVGQRDRKVLEINQLSQRALAGPTELVEVPGATHLFEEPGALEEVAGLSRDWFATRLTRTET